MEMIIKRGGSLPQEETFITNGKVAVNTFYGGDSITIDYMGQDLIMYQSEDIDNLLEILQFIKNRYQN